MLHSMESYCVSTCALSLQPHKRINEASLGGYAMDAFGRLFIQLYASCVQLFD